MASAFHKKTNAFIYMHQHLSIKNGVYCLSSIQDEFEQAYIAVREKEGRVLHDDEVLSLPHLPIQHPRRKEWLKRNFTLRKVLPFIKKLGPHRIMDLGCGNGWFTNCLAQETHASVTGVDMNMTELKQATRLFERKNCHFVYGDIFSDQWPEHYFDTITLNACVQYFPDLDQLISKLLELLRPNGTIHLLDSPFYDISEVKLAKERTAVYYQQQGIPEMIPFYHHHHWRDLGKYDFEILYQPNSMMNRWIGKLDKTVSPFPWIMVKRGVNQL